MVSTVCVFHALLHLVMEATWKMYVNQSTVKKTAPHLKESKDHLSELPSLLAHNGHADFISKIEVQRRWFELSCWLL